MVKAILKRKVPAYVQETPEWPVFLRWISQKNIRTSAQLKDTLSAEIKDCQDMLKVRMKNMRQGTNNRTARKYAKKLDFLKVVRDKIVKKYV